MFKYWRARRLLEKSIYLERHAADRWFLVSDTAPLTRMKELAVLKRNRAIELMEEK